MKHLGDITKINVAEIEPVDCITFGSPCQDLSVAGKRKGLEGERSGLFMEAVRVIKEMRENELEHIRRSGGSDESVRPRFCIWENVPGAFSSNKGEDFRVVLEELANIAQKGVTIPRPTDGRGGMENGNQQAILKEIHGALHGEPLMLNIGEFPKEERESHLSWILQEDAPEKYYLSPKACRGILNRASRRGKELPEILKNALENVIMTATLSK